MIKRTLSILTISALALTLMPLTALAAVPVVTVDTLVTSDRSPELEGTITENNATITVTVDGESYSNAINGAGTITISGGSAPYDWTLADNVVSNLSDGTYNVVVSATNVDGTGNDSSTNELVIDNVGATAVLSDNMSGRSRVRNSDNVTITATFTDSSGLASSYTPKITILNGGVSNRDMTATANDLVWTYNWDVPNGNITALVSVNAKDAAGNDSQSATGVTSYVIDNTAPVVGVSTKNTSDTTPSLSGTISENDATITVTVDGFSYSNAINGAGTITVSGTSNPFTWTLADNVISTLDNGTYDVDVSAADEAGNTGNDPSSNELTIDTTAGDLEFTSFNVSPTSGFDPSPSGENEDLTISYALDVDPDSVIVRIKDQYGDEVENFSSGSQTGSFSWDGQYAGKLVEPGTYTVEITATKINYNDTNSSATTTVAYNDSGKPDISDFTIDPNEIDPDDEYTTIEFTNDDDAYLTVEIRENDGDVVYDYSQYEHDNYNAGTDHTLEWDGDNKSGNDVSDGSYYIYVIARNNYGVSVEYKVITVDDDSGSDIDYSSSNSHISGISLSPSSTFEPAEDDELEIEFDVKKDLDELKIYAVRGSTEVEIWDDSNVDEENNMEVTWDGSDDDDDFVDDGTWKIRFESEVDDEKLYAEKSIKIEYDEPKIDDVLLTKDEIDPDLGESVHILFKVEDDAVVTINVLEDGDEDDELIEDMEVEKDKWYAVEWSSDGYDEDDDIEFEIIASNEANEDINDKEKIDIDLDEDDVSSRRSNITEDYITPVLAEDDEEREIHYNLEDEADVEITIYKGERTSGSKVIELLDVDDQEAGDHTILWDGKDDDGDDLRDGIYTYKIVSKKSSTETETGHFIVGDVGDIDEDNDSSSRDNDDVSPNVIIDPPAGYNPYANSGSYTNPGQVYSCAGFVDVQSGSKYCAAINWAKNNDIIQGYGDGTFRPDQPITRAEVLKVVLKSVGVYINTSLSGYTGFPDVAAGEWFAPYIKQSREMGIFNGDSDTGMARPNSYVNRAEVLKFIYEALRVSSGYTLNTGCNTKPYPDVEIGQWYTGYVCESKSHSLFANVNGYYFSPSAYATRGEVVQALYRIDMLGL